MHIPVVVVTNRLMVCRFSIVSFFSILSWSILDLFLKL